MNSTPLVETLVELSLRTLPRMIVEKEQLFCLEFRHDDHIPRYSPEKSPRYTIMALLGLEKAKEAGFNVTLDLEGIYTSLKRCTSGLALGDLGLMLWLAKRKNDDSCQDILDSLKRRWHGADWDQIITVELAWLLTGLTQAFVLGDKEAGEHRAFVEKCLLGKRSSPTGLFFHTGRGLRRRFPNFATQIYTLHALSVCSNLLEDNKLRTQAIRLGESIAGLQLETGGWPWIFDVQRGSVVEPFEVYSVHQDGMAPMAFKALQDAADFNAEPILAKGLRWLEANNELDANMIDLERGLVHRSIRRKPPRDRLMLYGRTLASALGLQTGASSKRSALELNKTCRPYHLGWILEAWCEKTDSVTEQGE